MRFIQSCIGQCTGHCPQYIQINGMPACQEVYIGRMPLAGTLESVCIIEVSAFQECPQGGVPLYSQ